MSFLLCSPVLNVRHGHMYETDRKVIQQAGNKRD